MHDAKLIWVTPDAEQLLGDIARVSNPANQGADPANLIGYMIREGHWSPFEMVNMCVEINTTRTIGRQLMRHSPKIQEFSQRYADPSALGNMVFTRVRVQDQKNRQASHDTDDLDLDRWWLDAQTEVEEFLTGKYSEALERGVAKELARNILPEGMTPSRLYFQANLRDWLFMVKLRLGHGTQREATAVAKSLYEILCREFPITTKVFYEKDKMANRS